MWGLLKPIFKPYEYWPSEACCCNSAYRLRYWNNIISVIKSSLIKLQQCLPFTVLKPYHRIMLVSFDWISCNSAYRLRYWNVSTGVFPQSIILLQQCLPFTVLKLTTTLHKNTQRVATVLTVYGIETSSIFPLSVALLMRCNSAYRLRYWNTDNAVIRIWW